MFCGATFFPPGGHDDVLLAVGDRDEAVRVHLGNVSGLEPAVGVENRVRRLRILEVPLEHRLRADEELPVVCDLDLEARHRGADGAEAIAARAVRAGRRRALGQPMDARVCL